MITVINIYTPENKHLREGQDYVLAMRPGPFGNPFQVARYGRERALELFHSWFHKESPGSLEMKKRLAMLPTDAVLGCCCKPKECHADILARWRNLMEQESVGQVGKAGKSGKGTEDDRPATSNLP
jgi:hypothetical protein